MMLNGQLFNPEKIQQLRKEFAAAQPFSYVCIDNFLESSLAKRLAQNFPALQQMDVLYNGLNEKKGEHADFGKLEDVFTDLKCGLMQPQVIKSIEAISAIEDLSVISDRYGCGLHQGGRGSFLDMHIDYNLHPQHKKQRRLNLVLFLNEEWKEDWGGYLELWDKKNGKSSVTFAPIFNRCVLFICNNISYHGYNKITCPDGVTRKSFYLYFFSAPQKGTIFHDTVFTPIPADATWRKYTIIGKEWAKNWVKRFMYYTRLNKLLK